MTTESTDRADTAADLTARLMHETYERLAPSFGYVTRIESAVPWAQVPEQNKGLMRAVAAAVRASVEIEVQQRERDRMAGLLRDREGAALKSFRDDPAIKRVYDREERGAVVDGFVEGWRAAVAALAEGEGRADVSQ